MRTIAISNQKGGCGKTTTTLNLGAGLAELGLRVLMLDLDPQSSLTLATVGDCGSRSLAEVIGAAQPGDMSLPEIIQEISPNLDLAPADIALSASELGFATRRGRENILKKILASVSNNYDVCLIDCGPSLGLLAVNALTAADAVICPTLPTALDMRGLALFLVSVASIKEDLNPGLVVLGVLVCQLEERLLLHQAAMDNMTSSNLKLFDVRISKSVQAAVTTGEGKPLAEGKLADQYAQLAQEVNTWLRNQK
jgi:chromosome partitioning protein